jgi:hypothetical protein
VLMASALSRCVGAAVLVLLLWTAVDWALI